MKRKRIITVYLSLILILAVVLGGSYLLMENKTNMPETAYDGYLITQEGDDTSVLEEGMLLKAYISRIVKNSRAK